MIKAIIFDCFGVVLSDALSVMVDELDPAMKEQVWSLINRANKDEITSEESSTQIAEMFGLSYTDYRARLEHEEVKDQALLDYIATLRASYKTAMLSNVPKGSLYRRFTVHELAQYFDKVIASGEIGYAKPEPEVYKITADQLGIRMDECVFIDDRDVYCEGARAVGMQTILYQNFTQLKTELEQLLSQS